MKRATIGLLAVTLCLSMLLGGCGKNQARKVTIGKATPTPAAQEAAVSASSAPAQDTSKSTAQTGVEVDIKKMEGVYLGENGKKGSIRLMAKDSKVARILIDWPDTTQGDPHWEMTGTYDPVKKELVYTDATMTRTVTRNGQRSTETVYTKGAGSIAVNGPRLTWNDAQAATVVPQSSYVYEMSLDLYQQKVSESAAALPTAAPTAAPTPSPLSPDSVTPAPAPLSPDSVTPVPTAEPTPVPTVQPTPAPTAVPTPVPTAEPTPVPTVQPTPAPTAEPTPVPTAEPTPVPTAEPTPVPTAEPTPVPTAEPTPVPTAEPTPVPTAEPTPVPTAEPTPVPTEESVPTAPAAEQPAPEDQSGIGMISVDVQLLESGADPNQEPAEDPGQAPAEDPVQTPAEDPYAEPTEESDQAETGEPESSDGWQPAGSMEEAAMQAGIEFYESVWSAVPDEINPSVEYQYQEGAARVIFEDEEQNFRLVIAKAYTQTEEGSAEESEYYSGGYIDYTEPVIGYEGSSGMIHAASFETDEYLYTVEYMWGEDGSGLTEEELVRLVYTLLGKEVPESEPEAEQNSGTEETPSESAAQNPDGAAGTYSDTQQENYNMDPAMADYTEPPQESYENVPQMDYNIDPAVADYAEAPQGY